MSAPSYADALRILELIDILQQHAPPAMRVHELAERLGVSTRTIGRYVRAVEDRHQTASGRPLLRRERRRGGSFVVLEPGEWLTPSLLRYAVASVALQASDDDTDAEAATAVAATSRSSTVPAARRPAPGGLDRRTLDRVRSSFHYIPADADADAEPRDEALIGVVLQGIVQQRAVRVVTGRNGAAGEAPPLSLEPFALVMHRDALYVVGRKVATGGNGADTARMRIDTLDLAQLAAAELTETRFERPSDFSPGHHFAQP